MRSCGSTTAPRSSRTPSSRQAGTTEPPADRLSLPVTGCHRSTAPQGNMDHIRLGRTDLSVSPLCLGTMSMGSSAWKSWVLDEPDSIPLLRRPLDLGINFFDMTDWYSTGRNEEVVGRNVLKMARREQVVLATKVFYPMSDDPKDRGLSRAHIAASIDRSLARIGTDHVDLYVIHAFDAEIPVEE